VADSVGAIHNTAGLDVDKLIELKNAGSSVIDYDDGEKLDREAVIDVECDIWIPAARPDVINEENVHRLNTRLVVEGANIPFTHGAEKYLHKKGVLCMPGFIANAGGVICAAMEYHGASQAAALQTIEEKLRRNTKQVLEASKREQILPREASMKLAMQRLNRAMSFRRYSLFSTAEGWI
jgi:glutamate dehydrogenase (NAD(P)+)